MKCKDCNSCKKGFFKSEPEAYVCIGVKEPFVVHDVNVECTEYPEKNKTSVIYTIAPVETVKAYVGDDGIYVPVDVNSRDYKMLISKELFVGAYNKWIRDV